MTMLKNLPGSAAFLAALGLFVLLFAADAVPALAQARDVSLKELTEASSDVVLGAVSTKKSFWNANQTRISTEVRLQVTNRIKGDAAEETVVVIPGGQVGNTLYEVSDMPVFIEGEEVLLFLWKDESGRHTVAGAAQGKLRVLKGEGGERVLEPGAAHLLKEAVDKTEPSGADHNLQAAEGRNVRLDDFVRAVKRVERE